MPRRNRIFWKVLLPLGLLAAVVAVFRRKPDAWEYAEGPDVKDAPAPVARPDRVEDVRRRTPLARFALAAAFTTLFFAGASFTAGAGDQAAKFLEDDVEATAEAAEIAAARADADAAEDRKSVV